MESSWNGWVMSTTDPVNRPAHYEGRGVECIDAIEAMFTTEEFVAFLRGQIVKYSWRLWKKDSVLQNAEKLRWYADRLVGALAKDPAFNKHHLEKPGGKTGGHHWTPGT